MHGLTKKSIGNAMAGRKPGHFAIPETCMFSANAAAATVATFEGIDWSSNNKELQRFVPLIQRNAPVVAMRIPLSSPEPR
jgi:hypothetical protein